MSNPQNLTEMRLQFGELNITPRVENRLDELGYSVADLEEAIANHKSPCDGEPSVYVGTYAKYNDGSLCGYGSTSAASTATMISSTSARLSTPTRKTRN